MIKLEFDFPKFFIVQMIQQMPRRLVNSITSKNRICIIFVSLPILYMRSFMALLFKFINQLTFFIIHTHKRTDNPYLCITKVQTPNNDYFSQPKKLKSITKLV